MKNFLLIFATFVSQFSVLKDYYYFLGVPPDASEEDIKKAYRKLSLKYHPDKTENDVFFQNRFREVQEAYDTLGNKENRKVFDKNFKLPTANNTRPPFIKTFSANKIRAKLGEEIIINWQTQNADVVKILPFGLEKDYGERIFKITEFQDGKFQILLHATNSIIQKTAVKGVTITQVFDSDREKIKERTAEILSKKQELQTAKNNFPVNFRFVIIFLVLLAVIAYFILN